MTLLALIGDCTTTTALALAAAYADGNVVVLEADRSGGSVAAWFDTPISPSLSAIVANQRGADGAGAWARIEGMIRSSRSGVRFVPAPTRSIEAAQAIEEAERTVFPSLAQNATVLADVGRRAAADGLPATVRLADTVIVCHRQATASAAAAGVRLERTAELLELLGARPSRLIVAVIGDNPFERGEIHDFLANAALPAPIETQLLEDDPLAAAVLAGRQGVSTKRFARLPLIRSCRELHELITGRSVFPTDEEDVAT